MVDVRRKVPVQQNSNFGLFALLEVMKNSLFVLFLVLAVLLPTCELKRVNKKRAKKKAAKSSNGGQQTRIKDSNVQLQVMRN